MFNKSIKVCSKVLKDCSIIDELKYLPNKTEQMKNNEERKRKRKIILVNPQYSKNIKTNVGKVFLKLIKKDFPARHILHQILTKSYSYCCMKNINSDISSHNNNNSNPRTASFG